MPSTFDNAVTTLSGTSANIYAGPTSASTDRAIIIGCTVTNTHASDDATVTVYKDTHELFNAIKIPANTSLEVCRGNKFVLKQNENLKAKVTAGSAKTMVSALVIT